MEDVSSYRWKGPKAYIRYLAKNLKAVDSYAGELLLMGEKIDKYQKKSGLVG